MILYGIKFFKFEKNIGSKVEWWYKVQSGEYSFTGDQLELQDFLNTLSKEEHFNEEETR